MEYQRPRSSDKLSKSDRASLLALYNEFYGNIAKTNPDALNSKLPREVFEELLNRIGDLLLQESVKVAAQPGPVHEFLVSNPLPPGLAERLPDDFRAFCLALNALKQWVAAEQSATDRYLFGASARAEYRSAAKNCLVSGADLTESLELHHPVRDGRPPIPLSKQAHARIEGQSSSHGLGDPTTEALLELRRARNLSWAHLKRGCTDLLGHPTEHSTPGMGASARAFARKASIVTGLDFAHLLEWLDERHLGG